jgi:LysR family glycine cleavage system transcriptional activator
VDADESRLSLTALPTFGSSWLTPRLGRFRAQHPQIALELEVSPEAQELGTGRCDAAIRNGHGRWPGLRTLELFPSVFMPLCAPALRETAAGIGSPATLPDLPLLGRRDWWALWFRALGHETALPAARFGIQLATEHLDIAAAIAGHGIAIGSPLLFRSELASGRLVPAHPAVAGDGRGFWFAWPAIRHASRKLARFRDWLAQEAEQEREASRALLARAVILDARG